MTEQPIIPAIPAEFLPIANQPFALGVLADWYADQGDSFADYLRFTAGIWGEKCEFPLYTEKLALPGLDGEHKLTNIPVIARYRLNKWHVGRLLAAYRGVIRVEFLHRPHDDPYDNLITSRAWWDVVARDSAIPRLRSPYSLTTNLRLAVALTGPGTSMLSAWVTAIHPVA